MSAIFRREFNAYFSSAIGYVYLVAFYVLVGISFSATLLAGSTSMTSVFSFAYQLMLFATPILTMRLLSEDKKQKTDQALLTAPVKLGSVVLGKYFAALLVLSLGLAVIVVYAIFLSAFAAMDWAVIVGSLFGALLMGAALLAIGMFISSLTENQVVAAIGTFAVVVLLMLMNNFISYVPVQFLKDILYSLSFYSRYSPFTGGVLDFSNVLYFLSVAVVFNFLTVRVLERRRWA